MAMNPGFAKYLAGKKAAKASGIATPVANANVGNAKVKHVSSGKMASVKKVSLGTTHGNHDVAHPC